MWSDRVMMMMMMVVGSVKEREVVSEKIINIVKE